LAGMNQTNGLKKFLTQETLKKIGSA
jgi:hypothetical protein